MPDTERALLATLTIPPALFGATLRPPLWAARFDAPGSGSTPPCPGGQTCPPGARRPAEVGAARPLMALTGDGVEVDRRPWRRIPAPKQTWPTWPSWPGTTAASDRRGEPVEV